MKKREDLSPRTKLITGYREYSIEHTLSHRIHSVAIAMGHFWVGHRRYDKNSLLDLSR